MSGDLWLMACALVGAGLWATYTTYKLRAVQLLFVETLFVVFGGRMEEAAAAIHQAQMNLRNNERGHNG